MNFFKSAANLLVLASFFAKIREYDSLHTVWGVVTLFAGKIKGYSQFDKKNWFKKLKKSRTRSGAMG